MTPREERLRTTVERLAGCLDELRTPQRRVLVLRAGLGPLEPLSRTKVSGRLDVSVRRVVGIERRGLRRLVRLERSRGCAGSPSGITVGELIAIAGPTVPARLVAERTGARASGGGGMRHDGSESHAGSGALNGVMDAFEQSAPSDPPPAMVPPPARADGGLDLGWLALVVGLGLLAFAVRRERLRLT